jgi:hypothetical protein
MLIYTFNHMLIIQSSRVITKAKVKIFRNKKVVWEGLMINTNFFSHFTDLSPGHYTVAVYENHKKTAERSVFFGHNRRSLNKSL